MANLIDSEVLRYVRAVFGIDHDYEYIEYSKASFTLG